MEKTGADLGRNDRRDFRRGRGQDRTDARAILGELLQGERLSTLAQLMAVARRTGNEAMQEEIARLVAAACAGPKR